MPTLDAHLLTQAADLTDWDKLRELAKQLCRYYFKDDKGQAFELATGQADIFICIYFRLWNRVEVIASTQYGKLISHSTPVLTSKGWTTHGQLKVGDRVFNEKGRQVRVTHLFDEGVANNVVEFTNGEKIECHDNHEWVVKSNYDIRRGYGYRAIDTKTMREQQHTKQFSIPPIKPLTYSKQPLPIDPYYIGAWLGDGSSSKCAITLHPADRLVADSMPYKITSECRHASTGISTYYFASQGITTTMKTLSLHNNKHIPEIYKTASVEQRLELLAGLIDTDGSVNKATREKGWRNGRVYIANANKQLIDDVVELLIGLGLRPSVTKVKATTSSSGIQGKQDVYYVGFAPYMAIPTRLPRKQISGLVNKRHVRIKGIKKMKPVTGRCIEVEGGIYLVGRKLIPTHNSSTVAMALILRSQSMADPWAVLAPDQPKANIIMEKVIQHTFDHPSLYSKLELDPNESLDRLRRNRTREHVSWKGGGSIRTFTADVRNRQRVKAALTGFGSPNIIEDEASLIPNDVQAMVMRMLGGYPDNFIMKIGNPWQPNPNHFFRTWNQANYARIFIDYKQALAEGRYTEAFIEEMRDMPFFDVLYECKFPPEDAILEGGYRKVITEHEIQAAFVPAATNIMQAAEGRARLGVDVGRGGNRTVFAVRYDNISAIIERNRDKDLMANVGKVVKFMDDYNIPASSVFIDDVGVGGGVTDRLRELGHGVNGVREGGKAEDETRFANSRAEMYWKAADWVKKGGKLVQNEGYMQLALINIKEDSSSRLKAEPKADLQKRGVDSPDDADAFSLTFAQEQGSLEIAFI